jgi:hypothetical protein
MLQILLLLNDIFLPYYNLYFLFYENVKILKIQDFVLFDSLFEVFLFFFNKIKIRTQFEDEEKIQNKRCLLIIIFIIQC